MHYYNEVGIAKKLGIVNGKADGSFNPNENISRQDMFMVVAEALRIAGVLEANAEVLNELNIFTDYNSVSSYAGSAVAQLVKGDSNLMLSQAG